MKWKYLVPAGLLACAMLNIQNVYAQDPITFTDENGERVSYGEQKEWTRTINYVFTDNSNRNHTVYQTTAGNEVWITGQNGITEYHIGNNGECSWEEVITPYVEGYMADIQVVPDVDLYWNPGMANNNYVTVTYTPSHSVAETPVISTPDAIHDTETPEPSESPDAVAKQESLDNAPEQQKNESAKEEIQTAPEKKAGIDWVIPGAVAICSGIGVASYFVIRKLNYTDDDDE